MAVVPCLLLYVIRITMWKWYVAVSYTHLDVYKRQDVCCIGHISEWITSSFLKRPFCCTCLLYTSPLHPQKSGPGKGEFNMKTLEKVSDCVCKYMAGIVIVVAALALFFPGTFSVVKTCLLYTSWAAITTRFWRSGGI